MSTEDIDIENEKAWKDRRSNLRESFNTANHFKQIAEEQNYQRGIADSLKILGYCYWRFSDYSQSLDHSLKAIEIYKELGDKKGEADTLNNVGAVYMFQNENQKRLECNLKCLQLRQETGDLDGVSGSMNNIGETYFEMADYSNAEKWLIDCLNYEHSSIDSRAWAYHNLGKIQQVNGNLNQAKEFFLKCLDLTAIDNYDVLTCETYIKLIELSLKDKAYSIAEDFGKKALDLAEKTGSEEYKESTFLLLSKVFEETGEYKKALDLHKTYHQTHTKIFNEANNQKIKDIGYQYEIDRINREAEIERLQKVELVKAYQEIELKNQLIEQKNKDITDSIRYAKKIQQALLIPEEGVADHLPEHFILFKPKDIVSGDFYWTAEKEEFLYLAVCDCTGHGVPGAFLTMLGTSFLNDIIAWEAALTPSEILFKLREKFINELGKTETRDGMDVSLIRIDLKKQSFVWSGALRPLLVFRNETKEIDLFLGDKQSICYTENQEKYTDISGDLNEGDIIYLLSDGFVDQFGGKRGKKFKMKNFMDLLVSVHKDPLSVQKETINRSFKEWKGDLEQVDDVCVIGVKI